MRAIVLAAGKGTRMRSEKPKVLHEILGRPMLAYVLEALQDLGIRDIAVVVGSGAQQVCSFLKCWNAARRPSSSPHALRRGSTYLDSRLKSYGNDDCVRIIFQRQQLGTGHALMMTQGFLRGFSGDTLIWPGDMPLLRARTLRAFIRAHCESSPEASVLSSLQIDPFGYGRILRVAGRFSGIREELDATEVERRIQEVNSGVYLFRTSTLLGALKKIQPANKKKEYYLTDTVETLSREDRLIEAFPLASASEAQGINTQVDLSMASEKIKNREIQKHQEQGVTFVAPEQTFLEPGVRIGSDTVIYPWCYIESGVTIGKKCQIGPFAKLRAGTKIGDGSVIGSFVEISRSRVGRKVLAKHLAYLGDAEVGDETNVGAGVITANFDGVRKNKTRIGRKVLIGSNTVFVAPVTVGDRARTGAGAIVTRGSRVKAGEVVVGVPARPIKKRK